MDVEHIKTLLEKAAERYNEGQYEEAIALWHEVMEQDPSNQKAREGVRMASLLTADWSGAPVSFEEPPGGDAQPDTEGVRARIEAGIDRVKELARGKQFDEAMEGCDLLNEIAPDLDEVKRLKEEIRRAAGGAASRSTETLETHLERARAALADGRNHQAADAARKAIAIDPSNMEACGILSLAADDSTASAPVSIGNDEANQPGPGDTAEFSKHDDAPGGGRGASTSDTKVKSLLDQGQQALASGRPEAAIEIWSRIFAIDRANAQAGALIDQAKGAIDEQARRVDDVYYRAVDAKEAGRDEEAIGLFEQVLQISPNHPEAHACLQELKARTGGLGEAAGLGGFGPGIGVDPDAVKEIASEKKRGFASAQADEEAVLDRLREPASVPLARPMDESPYPPRVSTGSGKAVAVKPAILSQRKGGGMKKLLMAAAGIGVVALAGVGAWLWFGSGTGSMPEAQATIAVPLKAASHASAKPAPGAQAAAIQVVPGSTPKKEEAAPPTPSTPMAPMTTEQLKAQAAELTREGRRLYEEQRWPEAVLTLKKALTTDPIDFDAQDELDKAMVELEKAASLERELTSATKYFGEADYASALTKFYRLQQDHPEMKNFDAYIRNSWFNWGVTLLQAGVVDEAAEKFNEVLEIDGRDSEAARAKDIAKRYHGRPRDKVFDTFAGTMTLRTLDQR